MVSNNANDLADNAVTALAGLIAYRWHRRGYDGLLISDGGRCVPVKQDEMPPATPFYPLTVRKATTLIARSIGNGHDYVTAQQNGKAA